MADIHDAFPENVEGPYYVDEQCIACGICPTEAPDHFKMSDDEAHAYVYKQPENEEEESSCDDALNSCPVSAIGDDG